MRTVSLQVDVELHGNIDVEAGGVELGFALHWKETEGPSLLPHTRPIILRGEGLPQRTPHRPLTGSASVHTKGAHVLKTNQI